MHLASELTRPEKSTLAAEYAIVMRDLWRSGSPPGDADGLRDGEPDGDDDGQIGGGAGIGTRQDSLGDGLALRDGDGEGLGWADTMRSPIPPQVSITTARNAAVQTIKTIRADHLAAVTTPPQVSLI